MSGKIRSFFKDNKDVVLLFLVSRLLFAVILLLTQSPYGKVLGLFDADHYRYIAANGYEYKYMTCFFPVIPMFIRFTGDIGLVIINHVAFFISLVFLKKILMLMGKSKVCTAALAVCALSPLAYFTSIEYTESLFFLFTVVVFYMFVTDKNCILMGIILGLAVMTRNTGSLLFFAVFAGMCYKAWKDKEGLRKRIINIFLCYIPATIISLIYPVYLQIRFGNWKVFVDTQYEYWLRIHSDFFRTVFISLKVVFTNIYDFHGLSFEILFRINEVLSLFLLGLTIYLIIREIIIMKRNKAVDINSVVAIIYVVLFMIAINLTIRDPLADCPTDSFYRYYASLFPLYLGLSKLSENKIRIAAIVSAGITVITGSLFSLDLFFF